MALSIDWISRSRDFSVQWNWKWKLSVTWFGWADSPIAQSTPNRTAGGRWASQTLPMAGWLASDLKQMSQWLWLACGTRINTLLWLPVDLTWWTRSISPVRCVWPLKVTWPLTVVLDEPRTRSMASFQSLLTFIWLTICTRANNSRWCVSTGVTFVTAVGMSLWITGDWFLFCWISCFNVPADGFWTTKQFFNF